MFNLNSLKNGTTNINRYERRLAKLVSVNHETDRIEASGLTSGVKPRQALNHSFADQGISA
jgi:hypothetical protein